MVCKTTESWRIVCSHAYFSLSAVEILFTGLEMNKCWEMIFLSPWNTWGLGRWGLAVKSICYSSSGPEFSSQNLLQGTHNNL